MGRGSPLGGSSQDHRVIAAFWQDFSSSGLEGKRAWCLQRLRGVWGRQAEASAQFHPCRLGGVRASQTERILELLRPLPEQSAQTLKGRFPKAGSVHFHPVVVGASRLAELEARGTAPEAARAHAHPRAHTPARTCTRAHTPARTHTYSRREVRPVASLGSLLACNSSPLIQGCLAPPGRPWATVTMVTGGVGPGSCWSARSWTSSARARPLRVRVPTLRSSQSQ